MPWKKDLAKLKQEMGQEDPGPAKPVPPPKVTPKAPVSSCIEEEDAVFLSAMGLRPQTRAKAAPAPALPPSPAAPQFQPPAPARPQEEFHAAMGDLKGMKAVGRNPIGQRVETPAGPAAKAASAPALPPSPAAPQFQPPAPARPQEEFHAAMGDLKGMKPVGRNPIGQRVETPAGPAAKAPAPARSEAPQVAPPAPLPPPPAILAPPPVPAPSGPVLIQLAAGMAVEVDGSLDLRGHGRSDGEERLKERLLDGFALGWRTLHVQVGASSDLREMVVDLIRGPEGRCVARYAQAPIPMGGPQAWILYFRPLGPAGEGN